MARVPVHTGARVRTLAATLISVVLAVGILKWADVVLIPIALAILLTFILSPVVTRLDRRGFKRVPAVLTVIGATGLVVLGLVLLVALQLNSLANDLPKYRDNIRQKIAALRHEGQGGAIEQIQATFELATTSGAEATDNHAAEESAKTAPPLAVQVIPPATSKEAFHDLLTTLVSLSPALEALATGGLALILVIFMLIRLEDLRNRLVSFLARDNLTVTTKALDEAGERISRYLLMQAIINATFGMGIGLGLLVIGVPYALLWGMCAALLRYIPYLGPWIAASLPIVVSVITLPGWTPVLAVVGLFLVLELISNNVMEPWLYGQGIGISEVALLVSAAFWTWIWGPVGLILATPLTVCLVVVGKYVPALNMLDRLLGDKPGLPPHATFLQRLLARDDVEAAEIIQQYCRLNPPDTVYDEVLVPALVLVRRDRERGVMTAIQEEYILTSIGHILTENLTCPSRTRANSVVAPSLDTTPAADGGEVDGDERRCSVVAALDTSGVEQPPALVRIVGCAAHKEAEELTLRMLHELVAPTGADIRVLSTRTLHSEVLESIRDHKPRMVVIAVLPPGGVSQARFLCKLLRKQFPDLRIIVGCWGFRGSLDRQILRFRSVGAHYVTTTLKSAADHVSSMARLSEAPATTMRGEATAVPVSASTDELP